MQIISSYFSLYSVDNVCTVVKFCVISANIFYYYVSTIFFALKKRHALIYVVFVVYISQFNDINRKWSSFIWVHHLDLHSWCHWGIIYSKIFLFSLCFFSLYLISIYVIAVVIIIIITSNMILFSFSFFSFSFFIQF